MDQRPKRDCETELDCLRSTYLDLIGESLVGRLNRDPPIGKAGRSYDDTHRENGWDWPSGAPSMIGAKRMRNLRNECERVIKEGVPGDFMETGVWRGGACIMMRAVLKAHGIADRRVIAADSFKGLPPPSEGVVADVGSTCTTSRNSRSHWMRSNRHSTVTGCSIRRWSFSKGFSKTRCRQRRFSSSPFCGSTATCTRARWTAS